jgi:preprotein translocase subunit SecG
MLRMALTILQVFSSVAIIALVLIQRGKGADAGAGFGAGASGTVFGARGARTALSRATAIFAAVFMLNSLALAYMGTQQAAVQPKSILDEVPATATGGTAPAAPGGPVPSGGLSPSVPAPATGDTVQTPAPAPADAPVPATAPQSGGTPPK